MSGHRDGQTQISSQLAEAIEVSRRRGHRLSLPSLRAAEVDGFSASLANNLMDEGILKSASRRPEVLFSLIQSSADRLGEDWLADRLGFADVTIRTSRLHGLLRECRDGLPVDAHGPAIAIVTLPWDDHLLGGALLEARLAHAGFATELQIGLEPEKLRDFDAIFLSVSNGERLKELDLEVDRLRRIVGPQVPIIVGGGAARHLDGDARGADFVTSSIVDALEYCARRTNSPRFLI